MNCTGRYLGKNPLYYLLDAGYDASYIYQQALDQDGQAIIKLNLRRHENKSTEFTDNDTPYCPAGHPMAYCGTEKKKLLNKFIPFIDLHFAIGTASSPST
ncbi:MAG: hypothetical protein VR68_04110 [Peptococcaceae bacterium BRH_c4a]|nr:MAG: hypothetical protein VR68_04110 [Peptococcaceae bacterium BRH_c4a]